MIARRVQSQRLVVLVVWITLFGVTSTAILAQGPANGRRVRWSSDIALKDVVRPGDTNVAVLKPEHSEPFVEEDTAERELLVRAANADYVVIADITSVTPSVIDQGRWATTEIASRVTRILRYNDDMPRKTPGTWQMVHDGAEIDIDGVVVKVGAYPVVRKGQRYLIFTSYDRKRGITHAAPAFLIDAGGILVTSETSVNGPLASVMNGMKLSDVARLLHEK